MSFQRLILTASVVALFQLPLGAAEKLDPQAVNFFEAKIRPVLVNQCYECHSAKSSKVKGGLLLDTRAGVHAGGDSGAVVVVGKAEESQLIKSLRHIEMPMPPKSKLPDNVINDFVKWINMGAPDPRDGEAAKAYKTLTLEESKSFWSFQAPKQHPAPKVKNTNWAKSDIDRFVLSQLEAKKLTPNGDADPAMLLRRLYFDLIGLPPTPQEVDTFVKAPTAQAYAKIVDQLLASSHFGERWGRYWLDLARYAETNGNADNVPFPVAFRYRDYVIKAFNEDRPYDQFVREQIAGDLMPAKTNEQRDQQIVATGLLALTSKPRAQNNPDYKYDLLADQIDVTTRTVMGLSVMCARCHDHKFDPISTKEYYSMAGIFDSTLMLFGNNAGKGNGNKGVKLNGYHTLSDGSEVMGVKDGKPGDIRVAIRGEANNLGDTAPRGFLKSVELSDVQGIESKGSGRLELANYLTSPNNPFTARVAANRIWQHLFGQGLVRSPDNFGNLGETPTHPELLDTLAIAFVKDGWSTKKLIRQIVLTRAYQMSSQNNPANAKIDPDNVSIWRMPMRRLDAEAIRDSILAVSGQLDKSPMKGTLLGDFQPKGKGDRNPKESNHRSVYQTIPRGAPVAEILSLFDLANPNLVVAQREVTTVPAQALFFMNSPFIQGQSRNFAGRVLEDANLNESGRIDLAYKMAFGRAASADERDKILAYLTESARDGGRERAWQTVCQTLFAAAEFRYVE